MSPRRGDRAAPPPAPGEYDKSDRLTASPAHPELVHRIELVHGALTGAAADLVETLAVPVR